MRKYLVILGLIISLASFGQNKKVLRLPDGTVFVVNKKVFAVPETVNILYNFPGDDSTLVSLSNTLVNGDIDLSTDLFETYADITGGSVTTHADSGILGSATLITRILNSKTTYSSAQMAIEPYGKYRYEFDFFQKTSGTNDHILNFYTAGWIRLNTANQLEYRYTTEYGQASRTNPSVLASGSWVNGNYLVRDNITGTLNINGTSYINLLDGGFQYLPNYWYGFMSYTTTNYGFDGWIRNFKMYNSGATSTLIFNCKSDSSTIVRNPHKFFDNMVITHPLSDVVKFTGGTQTDEYDVSYIDVDFHWPADLRNASNQFIYIDLKREGADTNAFCFINMLSDWATYAYSDTIKGTTSWGYETINRDRITVRENDNRYTSYMNYARVKPGQPVKVRVYVFAKNSASMSIRNIGIRYKSSSTETSTEYAEGSYTYINLGSPNLCVSGVGDIQPSSNSEANLYVSPIVYSSALYADYLVTVGDNIDADTTVYDTVISIIKAAYGTEVSAAIGNHDCYENASDLNYFKTAYRTFAFDSLEMTSRYESRSGFNLYHGIDSIANSNYYVLSYDNLRGDVPDGAGETYCTDVDTVVPAAIIDSIKAINPSAKFIINKHFPIAQHDASAIANGQTTANVKIFRMFLSRRPEVVAVMTGHRHLYHGTLEENGLPYFNLASMARDPNHPNHVLFMDIYDDYIRYSFKNFNGTTANSSNQANYPSGSFGAGAVYNQFPEFDGWMCFVVPINREITDNNFGRTQ